MNIPFFRNLFPTAALLLAAGSAAALSPSIPYRVRLPDLPAGQPVRLRFDLRVPEGAATNTAWTGVATVVPATDGSIGVLLDDTLRTDASAPGLEDAFRRADGAPLLLSVSNPDTEVPYGPLQTLLPVPYAHVAGQANRAETAFSVPGTLTVQDASIGTGGAADGILKVHGDAEISTLSTHELVVAQDATLSGSVAFHDGLTVEGSVGTEIDGIGAVPVGSILFWTKTTLPSGPEGTWAWCDGRNGTPDLRGLFPRGASDTLAPGTKGGSETVELKAEHIPSHVHPYSFLAPNNRNAGYSAKLKSGWKVWRGTTEQTVESEATGTSLPHDNMPAYLRLAFIMRIQ